MADHKVQHIAISFNDGSVGIMQFVLDPRIPPESWDTLIGYDKETGMRAATDEAIQAEIDKSVWNERTPVSWRRMTKAEYPTDRTYRNAWTDINGQLTHDMPKARSLHRDILREGRSALFAKLDADYLVADEQGNQAQKRVIATQKQKLRDVTTDPRIEAAQTAEELKALTLSVLTA